MSNGKGDDPRPLSVPMEEYFDKWDYTFRGTVCRDCDGAGIQADGACEACNGIGKIKDVCNEPDERYRGGKEAE